MPDQYKDAFLWAWTGLFVVIGIFLLFHLKRVVQFFHDMGYSNRVAFRIFRWVGLFVIVIKVFQNLFVLLGQ